MVDDRATAGFSCASCKMNARMSGMRAVIEAWGEKAVWRGEEKYMNEY